MDAIVRSATLKKDVMAFSRPSLGESSLNNGATMALPTELGTGYNIFEEPVPASATQKIWRGNEHTGRRYLGTRIRNKYDNAFAR